MRTEFYEKRDEKIVALRRQGLTLKAIGERYGLGVSRVSQIIQLSELEVSVCRSRKSPQMQMKSVR